MIVILALVAVSATALVAHGVHLLIEHHTRNSHKESTNV